MLEIGCGTGQLTHSLLARGLRVTAVEPGGELIARARERLAGAGEVRFLHARLEEAPLAPGEYRAVFAASSIHWVDPDVGWPTIAGALTDDGTLALLSYFGLDAPETAADERAIRDALAAIAPQLAADWPAYRSLDATLAGAAERRANVSDAWSWLGGYALARAQAAQRFQEAELTVLPVRFEHTAAELTALLGTMSFWARLSPAQRDLLAAEHRAIERRLGRPIRSSTAACLLTARRRAAA